MKAEFILRGLGFYEDKDLIKWDAVKDYRIDFNAHTGVGSVIELELLNNPKDIIEAFKVPDNFNDNLENFKKWRFPI